MQIFRSQEFPPGQSNEPSLLICKEILPEHLDAPQFRDFMDVLPIDAIKSVLIELGERCR